MCEKRRKKSTEKHGPTRNTSVVKNKKIFRKKSAIKIKCCLKKGFSVQ
jgi:hypothetical protein